MHSWAYLSLWKVHIFIKQYFPIPVLCNITPTIVIAPALGLWDILATWHFDHQSDNTNDGVASAINGK